MPQAVQRIITRHLLEQGRAGVFALSWSLDHIGPMARSAADCALLLNVIAGADPADPTALCVPVPDYSYQLDGDLRGLKVGLDENFATDNVEPATVAALRECLAVLKDAGATVVSVRFPDTSAALAAWTPLATAEVAAYHAANYPSRASDYGPGLAGLLDSGLATSGVDYARAHDVRQALRGEFAHLFQGVDVALVPCLARQNLTLADFSVFGSKDDDWPNLLRFTAPFDISATPTLSLPAGRNGEGAPFGFQLVAGHLQEALLLRAGHAWQRATPHHKLRPRLAP